MLMHMLVGAVFLDFTVAFDVTDYSLQSAKPKAYGFAQSDQIARMVSTMGYLS